MWLRFPAQDREPKGEKMHIPDGYLSPQTAGGLWAFMVPAWYWAGYKVKSTLSTKQAPLVAVGAAFAFVIMMFNVPLPGGTTGHAVGGTIIAIVIGPWAAVIAISVALVIQALFFADGGLLAIGANCFNMAFILPVSGFYTYRLLAKGAAPESPRRWIAAGAGSFVGLNLAALATAVEFGLQGDLFKAADSSALYSPYGLSTAIPAMMIPHLLVVGVIEAVVTSLIYIFLTKTNTVMLSNYDEIKAASSFKLKPLIVGLILLLVFAPLGLLATGTAWGEWGTEDIVNEIGYVPEGMANFAGRWEGILPDYAFPGSEETAAVENDNGNNVSDASTEAGANVSAADANSGEAESPEPISLEGVWQSTPAYLVSGVIGMLVVSGISVLSIRMLTRNSRKRETLG